MTELVFGKHFFKYYKKYFLYFIIGIAFLVFVNIIQTDIPNLLGQIIDILNDYNVDSSNPDGIVSSVNSIIFTVIKIVAAVAVGRFIWRIPYFWNI